ncbi:MAG: winged helix-turn-helix transcriptional regulator [Thermonemataceae bacterium]
MTQENILKIHRDFCPLIKTAAVLGDKWLLMIIRECFFGYKRFEDFQDHLAISKSVLSKKLKYLLAQGILKKYPYKTEKQRIRDEYKLTQKGKDLYKVLIGLIEWGNTYYTLEGTTTVQVVAKQTREEVALKVVDKNNKPFTVQELSLTSKISQ